MGLKDVVIRKVHIIQVVTIILIVGLHIKRVKSDPESEFDKLPILTSFYAFRHKSQNSQMDL